MSRLTYLKLALGGFLFFALYFSFNIPIPSIQKMIQVSSLLVCLVLIFLIMRNPNEKKHLLMNGIVMGCIVALLIALGTI